MDEEEDREDVQEKGECVEKGQREPKFQEQEQIQKNAKNSDEGDQRSQETL